MRRSAWIFAVSVLCALSARAAETITPEQAEEHAGQEAVVEGRVLGIHCSPTSCLLAFDPSFNRFTAVVQAESFKTLPPETLKTTFVGRKVRVHGTIQMLEKKPEIVVDAPEDLQLVVTEEERAAEKATTDPAILDRLDALVDRMDALIARVDNVQARLEQMAGALDQRMVELETITASLQAPPPPGAPSYGTPQPRPAYEALRSIKRGMTSDQVARLIGNPLDVASTGTGSVTWDYGYGRSITFDERGRAVSFVGFPAP
jgi:hypothetical protein